MQRSVISPILVNANDLPNMRPTMLLMFIGGKLHQQWVNDDATHTEWRKVESRDS